jgi:hypothetical protein
LTGGSGGKDLYLVFSGSGSNLFKFNWWQLEAAVSPQIIHQPRPLTVALGGRFILSVESGELGSVSYQWLKGGVPINGATSQMFEVAAAASGDAGNYTVEVTNVAGTTTSSAATITVMTTANPGRLTSISTRSLVGTGADVQIAGFAITGGASKEVLVRAAGPALNVSFGLVGVLADPAIALHNQGTGAVIESNDDWDSALSTTFGSVGAFAWTDGSKDAALQTTLQPGAYTAVVSGTDGGTGIAIVEVYEIASGVPGSTLTSISTRSLVDVDDDVQIGGFAIGGSTARTVVIRASGPALDESFGLVGALINPVVSLIDQSNGNTLATAENWDSSLTTHFDAVGAFAWTAGSRDAAIVTTLNPGSYTVIVSGKNKGTGVALIEIYDLP